MWLLSVLRNGGLIVYDQATKTYRGDTEWNGARKYSGSRKRFKKTIRDGKQINRGGRTIQYDTSTILECLKDGPKYVDEIVKFCRSSEGISERTVFRQLKRLKSAMTIIRTGQKYCAATPAQIETLSSTRSPGQSPLTPSSTENMSP